jgi:hypothetical protein
MRLKDRDEDAYREVLARYSDPLYRYLYGITGNMQLSQDLLGDAFLRVVEQPTSAATAPIPSATDAAAPTAPVQATPTGPVADIRSLLAAAAADGRAGPQGEALLASLDSAQQALVQGDQEGATAQLAGLQRTLLQEARNGTLAPGLLRQALSGIDAVADEAQLTLPLSVSAE